MVRGSTPKFERRNRGRDISHKVGSVECRIVVGAMDHGSVHEDKELRVGKIDLGGCVEGVSMSLVLAMSRGDRIMPARPAADTATARVAMGAGEESISRPPAEPMEGLIWKERLGSGMAKMAAKKDRANDVMVDSRIEWTYVLLVPFQIPHAPSVCQVAERTAVKEDDDRRSRVWGVDRGVVGGEWEGGRRAGEPRLRRARDCLDDFCSRGAVAVKYEGDSYSESEEES